MLMLIIGVIVIAVIVGITLWLRRLGGGRFPWFQFYTKGKESGFNFNEINLLRTMAVASRMDTPTSLFWSIRRLDRSIRDCIIRFRANDHQDDGDSNLMVSKMFDLRKKIEFSQPKYKLGLKSTRDIQPRTMFTISMPGLGRYSAMLVENQRSHMALSYPEGKTLPEGFNWTGQKIAVSFWRTNDAGYSFITKVTGDHSDKKYQILHASHTDKLVRAQRRRSIRVETSLPAQLYPLKRIEEANELVEDRPGLRCRMQDVSEDGAAIVVGGRAKVGLPIKFQFTLGEALIVMCGVVKSVNFNQKTNRSVLHVQAVIPGVLMRNEIRAYVYNLFGERPEGKPAAAQAV